MFDLTDEEVGALNANFSDWAIEFDRLEREVRRG